MIFNDISIDIYTYSLETKINSWLNMQINSENNLKYILLFLGGLLSGFNPCLLSIVPLNLVYSSSLKTNIKPLSFMFGIISCILTVIFLISFLNYKYKTFINQIPIIGYLCTIFVGLILLEIIKIPIPSNKNFFTDRPNIQLQNYMVGFLTGLNITPCSSSGLITIVLPLYYSNQYMINSIYVSIYLVGYILPLSLITFFTLQKRTIKQIRQIWTLINPISGCVILCWSTFYTLKYIFSSYF